jgi:predicted enzyme related to lactoylglutathione lyase
MKLKLLLAFTLLWLVTPISAQQPNQKERNKPMTEPKKFALTKVGQIAVRVKDINRAAAFYGDKLGMKLLLKQSNLAVLDCGGLSIFLTLPENEAEGVHNSIIYFDVEDIQKTAQSLTEQGVLISEKPNKVGKLGALEVWIAIFRDSEENLMGLRSMVPVK